MFQYIPAQCTDICQATQVRFFRFQPSKSLPYLKLLLIEEMPSLEKHSNQIQNMVMKSQQFLALQYRYLAFLLLENYINVVINGYTFQLIIKLIFPLFSYKCVTRQVTCKNAHYRRAVKKIYMRLGSQVLYTENKKIIGIS